MSFFRNLEILQNMWIFVSVRPFQSSVVFEEKAWSLPRYSTLVCYSLTRKHNTRLEKLNRDKHFNFLAQFYNKKVFLTQPKLRFNLSSYTYIEAEFVNVPFLFLIQIHTTICTADTQIDHKLS